MTITITIIIITAVISLSAFNNPKVINDLIFYPPDITNRNQWYRFITCGFIHADMMHLFFNMFSLYFFGRFVEGAYAHTITMGKVAFIGLYVSALVISLIPTYLKHKDDYYYRSLGASGAVSAVTTAAVLYAPWQKIYLFAVLGMPLIVYAILFVGLSAYMSRKGGGNINHDAHLWGALYGIVFTALLLFVFNPDLFRYLLTRLINPTFF